MARGTVVHVVETLLAPSETFVQQRLVPGAYRSVALAWRRVEGLDVPCPFVVLPARRRAPKPGETRTLADKIADRARDVVREAELAAAIARLRPSVVHAHFGGVGIAAMRACRWLGVPLVVSFYGVDAGAWPRVPRIARAYAALFRSAAAVTGEGPALARRLVALGAPPASVKLLPLGLPAWATAPPRRAVAWDAPTLQLLQIARFIEKKGIDTTLRALAIARARGVDARLLLVGDGPLRPDVERWITELGLGAHVDLPGFVPHARLAELVAGAHLFVHPSRTAADGDTEGGHPTILLEVQAQGIPVVATRHADIPVAVRDGETGLLSPENDADALAANIAALFADRARLAALGDAARPHVLRRHDPAVLVRLRDRLYREAIRRHAALHGPPSAIAAAVRAAADRGGPFGTAAGTLGGSPLWTTRRP